MKNLKPLLQTTFMILLLVGVYGSFIELRQLNQNLAQQNLRNGSAVQTSLNINPNTGVNENPFVAQQVEIVWPHIPIKYKDDFGVESNVNAIPVVIVGK